MKENKCPKCPECGSPLILSVDTTGVWSRKIVNVKPCASH